MQKLSFFETLDQIVAEDQRYEKEAYLFVREALDFTIKTLKKDRSKSEARHVSGQELLDGIRQFALKEFGPMTLTVFHAWGIKNCTDFGEIVFNLVAKGILGKTDQDRREDFQHGYDFEETFVLPFLPPSALNADNPHSRLTPQKPVSRRPIKKPNNLPHS